MIKDSLGPKWDIFEIDGILPAVMKKRKQCLLQYAPEENAYMLNLARTLNEPNKRFREVVSVTHGAFFWDYGLCAVDVLITFRLLAEEGLTRLYPLVEAFEEDLLSKDLYKIPGMDSWEQVQSSFSKAFQAADMQQIHWLTPFDAETYLLETCTWNLQCIQAQENGIALSKDTLEKAFEEFCGSQTTEETFDNSVAEFFATHTGYSGNCAIVINEEEANRVRWLWKTVAILYSALLDSSEPCYDLVTKLIIDSQDPHSNVSLDSVIRDIRLVQKIIDLLKSESNPVTICSESFDAEIYEKVYNCWGGAEISASIDERTQFLMNTLSDLSQQQSNELQNRLNVVVFVLTIVSVASTVAAIIALQDVDNQVDSTTRAVILGVLTGLVGIMCFAVVALNWKRLGFKCLDKCGARGGRGSNNVVVGRGGGKRITEEVVVKE